MSAIAGSALALFLIGSFPCRGDGQITEQAAPEPSFSGVESLGLPPGRTLALNHALETHDYVAAEKLLLPEIRQDGRSPEAAHLLTFVGGIYYLNRDYLNAAIAWKKSEAIAPLPQSVQFTLAMAYIELRHPDWARTVLENLATANPKAALYPYWLGRIEYDADAYSHAVDHFKQAIALDPDMARAYDNLGLCYYHQNDNVLSVQSFTKAIELDRASGHPSAWPYLNLAVTLMFMNRLPDAETNLRAAIRLDPKLAQAHFQLGTVLERLDHDQEAIEELHRAASLDPAYAEPHFALARIYRKLGQDTTARTEVQTYLRLHSDSGSAERSRSPE